MPCSGETNLEGLRYPSKYLAIPNVREELFIEGWSIVSTEVNRLTELAYNADKKGDFKKALTFYKGANIFFYLIHLGINIRNFIDKEGTLFNECLDSEASEKYKLDCVRENLQCLSKKYCTNYVTFWEDIQKEFGIYKSLVPCEIECCLGISNMEINLQEDCEPFQVGPCDFTEPDCPITQFSLEGFACEQFN